MHKYTRTRIRTYTAAPRLPITLDDRQSTQRMHQPLATTGAVHLKNMHQPRATVHTVNSKSAPTVGNKYCNQFKAFTNLG